MSPAVKKKLKRDSQQADDILGLLGSVPFPESTALSYEQAIDTYRPPFLPPISKAAHPTITLCKPASVTVVGSHACGLSIADGSPVDVFVAMPAASFHHKDYMDYRYHVKCTLFLAHIGMQLKSQATILWQETEGHLPAIAIEHKGRAYRVTCGVSEDIFNVALRLAPLRSCLQPPSCEEGLDPTPVYNASLAMSILTLRHLSFIRKALERVPALCDAIRILKAWLHCLHYSRFVTRAISPFAMTMLACHLTDPASSALAKIPIHPDMDALQAVRVVMQVIGRDWSSSMEAGLEPVALMIEDVNVLSGSLLPEMQTLAREARSTLTSFSSIDKLAPVSLLAHYDATFVFSASLLSDSHGYEKLYEGLKERCTDIVIRHHRKDRRLLVSVRFNPDKAFQLVELGPLETQTEAAGAFRALWGVRCELRRFKDASVREAVVWDVERHLVVQEIARYLMSAHYKADLCWSSSGLFDFAMQGTASNAQINEAFDRWTRLLRSIPEVGSPSAHGQEAACLPLAITHCQPLYAAHCFADLFPTSTGNPSTSRGLPSFCPVHEFTIEFEASGRWPLTRPALRAAKQAFLLHLASVLQTQPSSWRRDFLAHEFPHSATKRVAIQASIGDGQDDEPFLDLAFLQQQSEAQPIVFRAFVHIPKEREMIMKGSTLEEQRCYNRRHIHRRTLAVAARSVHDRNAIFGPVCRLAKRWLACQLLAISDDLVEQSMVDGVFSSAEASNPLSLTCAFARWLAHARDLPSADELPKGLLVRWKLLAGACLDLIQTAFASHIPDLTALFTPNYADYDCLLHLDGGLLSRHSQAILVSDTVTAEYNPPNTQPALARFITRQINQPTSHLLLSLLPGFDSADSLLAELRQVYGRSCDFFYDMYGGRVIALRFASDAAGSSRERREEVVKGMRSLAKGIVQRYEFISGST